MKTFRDKSNNPAQLESHLLEIVGHGGELGLEGDDHTSGVGLLVLALGVPLALGYLHSSQYVAFS
jgi:hypothetical protein